MSDARGLHIELIRDRSAVPLAAEQWNALVARNETNTVFQTYEWFDAWWRAFGGSQELFMLLVLDGPVIIGFAALTLTWGAFGWRELRFAGAGNADYQDFVLPQDKPRALAAICEFLRGKWLSWDRLSLANIPAESSTLALLGSATNGSGLRLVDETRVTCPTLLLREDPLRARRMIDKYSLRRPLNWFTKHGKISFRHVNSVDEVMTMLPAFFAQHRARWQAVGKRSLFAQAKQVAFYEELARTLGSRGWLQFSVVEFNGEPIAFHFGFDYGGSVTWYKPSFDMRWAEHSPGLLLTRGLIEDGLNRDRLELDFAAGDEAFKGRFASRRRFNVHSSVYHGRLGYGVALGIRALRRGAGRSLRWWKGLFAAPIVPSGVHGGGA
jgi:CelD/BcsL family acetyltransferase involved in cellulose biosynthesis